MATLVFSWNLYAYQPISAQPTQAKFTGSLPEPYKTYRVEIDLNQETRDAEAITIYRGDERIEVPTNIITQLKCISINSVYVAHSMYREESDPTQPALLAGCVAASDWLYVSISCGDYKTVDLTHNGVEYEMTGQDRFVISIDNNNHFSTNIIEFENGPETWCKKTTLNQGMDPTESGN